MVYFLGFVKIGYAAGHEESNAVAEGFKTETVFLDLTRSEAG